VVMSVHDVRKAVLVVDLRWVQRVDSEHLDHEIARERMMVVDLEASDPAPFAPWRAL
jgi:hypothetical protein